MSNTGILPSDMGIGHPVMQGQKRLQKITKSMHTKRGERTDHYLLALCRQNKSALQHRDTTRMCQPIQGSAAWSNILALCHCLLLEDDTGAIRPTTRCSDTVFWGLISRAGLRESWSKRLHGGIVGRFCPRRCACLSGWAQ